MGAVRGAIAVWGKSEKLIKGASDETKKREDHLNCRAARSNPGTKKCAMQRQQILLPPSHMQRTGVSRGSSNATRQRREYRAAESVSDDVFSVPPGLQISISANARHTQPPASTARRPYCTLRCPRGESERKRGEHQHGVGSGTLLLCFTFHLCLRHVR